MRKGILAGVGMVLAAALAVGLWAFEPWRLFTSSTLDEAVPGAGAGAGDSVREVAETTAPSGAATPDPPGTSPRPSTPEPTAPRLVILGEGELETAEHETSGTAFVVEGADGSRFVRLEGLATSDGPDLHVGLSDAPSGGSWGSYDDGRYVGLGELKATHGNHNYVIPADVDLAGLTTVVIWCDRFDVAFGTADVLTA